MKITKTDVIETLKDGGKLIGGLALRIYGESLNRVGKRAFSEAIEVGIENTIASLYDAKVSDKEIFVLPANIGALAIKMPKTVLFGRNSRLQFVL